MLVQGKGNTSVEVDVPDIEEMCATCEPLTLPEGTPGLVTAFPMKVERKKPREELDIVNVVEWRRDDHRFFLLVRRPEGGKLETSFLCYSVLNSLLQVC
jgi:A/G-specific adenine glycosylase